MRKTMVLFRLAAKRNMYLIGLAVAGGLILCLLYSWMGDLVGGNISSIPIGVIDRDKSALSGDFLDYLGEDIGMEITSGADYEHLSTELVERHISAIVEIPEGFHRDAVDGSFAPVTVTTLDDYANAAYLQAYMDSYMGSLRIISAGANGDILEFNKLLENSSAKSISVRHSSVQALSNQQLSQQEAFLMCVGFFLMLSFFFGMALSMSMYDDRTGGMYQRIQAASVRPVQYVAGTSLFCLIGCLLFAAVYFIYVAMSGYYVGMPIGTVLALVTLYSLFVIGTALVLSLYLKSKYAITSALVGTCTISCLLGGSFFPIDTSPLFLQNLARISPAFWVMDAMRGLQANPDYNWGQNALVIGLFALLTFILAGIRFAKRSASVSK